MKVKMLKTVNGTVDGERMGPYHRDHEYDLDESRARLFIGSAMAEEVLPPAEVIESSETIEVQTVASEFPEHVPSRRSRKISE